MFQHPSFLATQEKICFSQNPLKLLLNLILAHRDHRRSAVRTVIRIFERQQLLDQCLHLCGADPLIALDRRLAGSRRNLVPDHLRCEYLCCGLRYHIIQKLQKQCFRIQIVQIIRNCQYRIFASAKFVNLKAQLFQFLKITLQCLLFGHGQAEDDRRAELLGRIFTCGEGFHVALKKYLFMRRMLIDNIELILCLREPVGVKQLPDHMDIRFFRLLNKSGLVAVFLAEYVRER